MVITTSVTGFYIAFGSLTAVALGGTYLESRRARNGDMVGAQKVKTVTTILLTTVVYASLYYLIVLHFPLWRWLF